MRIDAAQGLKRAHNGQQRPARQELLDSFDAPDALFQGADRVDEFLQRNLVSGVVEALFLQPAKVAGTPGSLTRKDVSMLEHERAHLLPVNALGLNRGGASATRSRIASWPTSGTHTGVNSPARSSLANPIASRVLVFTLSPARLGISDGDHVAGMTQRGDQATEALASSPAS